MREVIEGIRLGRLDVESGETIWEDGGSDPGSVVIEALADGKIRISHGSREVLSTSCSDEMVRNNFRHDCHSVWVVIRNGMRGHLFMNASCSTPD